MVAKTATQSTSNEKEILKRSLAFIRSNEGKDQLVRTVVESRKKREVILRESRTPLAKLTRPIEL